MSIGPDALNARLLQFLRSSVNADGGWGYSPGKASRLEPTCWALLALLSAGTSETEDESRVHSALALLAARQDKIGLLIDVPGAFQNFAFNGLAAIATSHASTSRPPKADRLGPDLKALVSAITAGQGVRSGRSWINRQDNELSGWPWHDGVSNWVEPTAWCALALKKTAPAADARVASRLAEADRLLADRCCLTGGWNYGNSNMLGKELSPFVLNSALALLALQDRRALPEVVRSIEWLDANWQSEPSDQALSLALVAMHVYGERTRNLERALLAHLEAAGPAGSLAAIGSVLYALNGPHHGCTAFTV